MRFVALAFLFAMLPILIGALRKHPHRRDWAVFAIGLLMFLTGSLRIDASAIAWPLWPGSARGLTISIADVLGVAMIMTRRRVLPTLPPFALPIIIFTAICFLTMMLSAVKMASFFYVWQMLRVLLALYVITGELIARPTALPALLGGLASGLVVQGGYVAVQKIQGVVQATGSLVHQNLLGVMTELAMIPLIAAVLEGDRRKIVYAGILGGLIVVAGGGSRATVGLALAGAAFIVLLSIVRRPSARKAKIFGIGILIMAAAVPAALATLSTRFGDKTFVTDEQERQAFERAAQAIVADHPFGIGPNMYVTTANVEGYAERAGVAWNRANRSAPVHNVYLLMRAETGWLGGLAFLAMLVAPIVIGFRAAFRDRTSASAGIALGSASAILVAALHNNYEFALSVHEAQMLTALNMAVIGAVVLSRRIRLRTAPTTRAPGGDGTHAMPGLTQRARRQSV